MQFPWSWNRSEGGGGPSNRNPENIVVEQPKRTLPDLLEEHTLPRGLFPKDITDFKFDENTKQITVIMPDDKWELICNACVLRFSKTVTGFLERGKLSNINEIQTQTGIAWGKISCIEISRQSGQRNMLAFTTDQLGQTKPFGDFNDVKNGRPF